MFPAFEKIQSLAAYFSNCFGKLGFSTMCLGLAVGLPGDVCAGHRPLPAIQLRAMSIIRDCSEGSDSSGGSRSSSCSGGVSSSSNCSGCSL